jgi:hypothetical protein
LGSGQGSSGEVRIASGQSSVSAVNICNGVYNLGDPCGSVNIFSNTNDSFSGGDMNLFTTSRGNLTVGGTNNNSIVFNKAPQFSSGLTTNTIDPTTVGGTLQIGHGSTTNNVEIASQASRSVVLHLGDGNLSSGAVHVGNGAGSSNNVQILNGNYTSGQTAGQVNILTGTHAVGTIGGNCNIFTGSRGTLTIGSTNNNSITVVKQTQFTNGTFSDKMDPIAATSAMTIGGTLIAAGSLTLGGAGTVNISKPTMTNPMSVSYLPSAIVSTNIGYKLAFTNISSALVANTAKSIMSVSLPAGVWLLQATIQTPTPATYQGLSFSTTNNTMDFNLSASQIIVDDFFPMALNICFVASISATTTYYLVAIAGNTRTLTTKAASATRLA